MKVPRDVRETQDQREQKWERDHKQPRWFLSQSIIWPEESLKLITAMYTVHV